MKKKLILLLLIPLFFCSYSYSQKIRLILKGVPFSLRSSTQYTEENIDSINSYDEKMLTYYYDVKDRTQIMILKKLLTNIIVKNKGSVEGYEVRMGLYFGKKNIEKFYFDVSQRLVYQGKVYKPTKTEIKNIFSLICEPKFIKSLNGFAENRYWKYSPICK
jgi:hypothetical protein